MAFMGTLVLALVAMLIFIIAICVFLFVFTPCLIIFIINLVKGIKNKWPKSNMVAVIITGIVLSIIISFTLAFFILVTVNREGAGEVETSASEAAIALQYLLLQIKY